MRLLVLHAGQGAAGPRQLLDVGKDERSQRLAVLVEWKRKRVAMTNEIEIKIVKFMDDLGEHCESIRLFTTFPEGDGCTGSFTIGRGNFHAQRGQIQEWLINQDENVRINARKKDDE